MILALWLFAVAADNIVTHAIEQPVGPMPCVFELQDRSRWEV